MTATTVDDTKEGMRTALRRLQTISLFAKLLLCFLFSLIAVAGVLIFTPPIVDSLLQLGEYVLTTLIVLVVLQLPFRGFGRQGFLSLDGSKLGIECNLWRVFAARR